MMDTSDTNKYSAPKLPTIQNMLEDLTDPSVLQQDDELKISTEENMLCDAYKCYVNIKMLKEDIAKQNGLNTNLEDLNTELVQNIENMKKQQ